MPPSLTSFTGRVVAGESLSQEEMSSAMEAIMSGGCEENEIGMFLTALAAKGETVEEVAGAAQAMRRHMTRIQSCHSAVLDTCGTGGGGSRLFNVSTTTALVVAAAGVPVAKHGNRSVTSRSGSADVLSALGVNIEAEVPQVEACLDRLGICFCFAPLSHPSMRHVAAVRKKLGIRTIFNILGPLANPAGAEFQLLGAGRPELRPLLAGALQKLGTRRTLVVSGHDGLGDLTLTGPTDVIEVTTDELREYQWVPEDFGLERSSLESLEVDGPQASADMIRGILEGRKGAARDIVVLNAAAALWLVGRQQKPREAAREAEEVIDSGRARDLLTKLADLSHLQSS